MRKSLLIPDAMICSLWKAVCVEMRPYRLGRGQRKRAEKYLASALLHFEAEAGGVIPHRPEPITRRRMAVG